MASDAERIDQESGIDQEQENPNAIKVRIDKLFTDDSQKLKAIASITLGEFAVHGFKVWEKDNKTYTVNRQIRRMRKYLCSKERSNMPFIESWNCFVKYVSIASLSSAVLRQTVSPHRRSQNPWVQRPFSRVQ